MKLHTNHLGYVKKKLKHIFKKCSFCECSRQQDDAVFFNLYFSSISACVMVAWSDESLAVLPSGGHRCCHVVADTHISHIVVNNYLNVFVCFCVLHTAQNPSAVFGYYVVKFLPGWAEHPRSWASGRLEPTKWRKTGRQWSEVTHITFSWRALSCQAWFTIICHPVVEIGNGTYSTKYACIRPGDKKIAIKAW